MCSIDQYQGLETSNPVVRTAYCTAVSDVVGRSRSLNVCRFLGGVGSDGRQWRRSGVSGVDDIYLKVENDG